ncbi:peptidoglycan editing factor PgeF [uncultured Hyphomonas sp.]|uniref:peptidoglycan editing factor PgeF n=1 Tax=uncultured Hyphomonas sp. TaxID=225298 RepID=UPI002AAB3BC5|nr:peptidoglycan editing factor PgeF [uncultured Hyphomonas sp.]
MTETAPPPFETAPGLAGLKGVRHGFFGRKGGVSTGLYASLNAGAGSDDDAAAVARNREIIRAAMGADALLSCHQIHSADVVHVTEAWDADRPQADAMVTSLPGLALCILTADCTPVLFADAEAGVIGAAHAGWKGALGGVLESTVASMTELGAEPARIRAAIGPTIGQASYEVGPEFRDTFLEASPASEHLFVQGQGDRYHFDLPAYCHASLAAMDIGHIADLGLDTCALEDGYFSNRRRNHRGEPDYGRNASVIVLEA